MSLGIDKDGKLVSSEVSCIVSPKSNQRVSCADIEKTIEEHARSHRCIYADWYRKDVIEKADPQDIDAWNSTFENDPKGYYTTLSLFDLFFFYVLKSRRGVTPEDHGNRKSVIWNKITVDDVINVLRKHEASNSISSHIDECSLYLEIDKDLDKTWDMINKTYKVELADPPSWCSYLEKTVYQDKLEKQWLDERTREVYAHCLGEYKKWKSSKS